MCETSINSLCWQWVYIGRPASSSQSLNITMAQTSRVELQKHKYWDQVQTLPKDLAYLLQPDVDYTQKSTKKEDLRDMMRHFGIDQKQYPASLLKAKLVERYQQLLLPDLQPFITQVDTTAKKTKNAHTLREAPFLQPTTLSPQTLRSAILTKIRSSFVPQAFSKTALTRLWRHAFHPLPKYTFAPVEFYTRPHVCTNEADLATKGREWLWHALQCEHPEIFIPLVACTEPILRALYKRFVLEKTSLDELCYGVHYYISEPDSPIHNNSEGKKHEESNASVPLVAINAEEDGPMDHSL
ncbi:uncharacterized protein MELLADRAFT_88677 [Melampsora larici-populina 98AG31]|uniref:Uncharacterized protein n=1 Tax=Melampsora larici-populina (strain 98AG31 / pathotype 3-4-7) TaxID=747676 RepID=F4RSK6_MELLP|nr:uncharacterized protein MELLADRAFT_88677 [Melampsora larici-populina 98AG31]EGG04677.1 hypothetical protein MELLADRAFT_88677 [Melampsora larici-populina 98AG31]